MKEFLSIIKECFSQVCGAAQNAFKYYVINDITQNKTNLPSHSPVVPQTPLRQENIRNANNDVPQPKKVKFNDEVKVVILKKYKTKETQTFDEGQDPSVPKDLDPIDWEDFKLLNLKYQDAVKSNIDLAAKNHDLSTKQQKDSRVINNLQKENDKQSKMISDLNKQLFEYEQKFKDEEFKNNALNNKYNLLQKKSKEDLAQEKKMTQKYKDLQDQLTLQKNTLTKKVEELTLEVENNNTIVSSLNKKDYQQVISNVLEIYLQRTHKDLVTLYTNNIEELVQKNFMSANPLNSYINKTQELTPLYQELTRNVTETVQISESIIHIRKAEKTGMLIQNLQDKQQNLDMAFILQRKQELENKLEQTTNRREALIKNINEIHSDIDKMEIKTAIENNRRDIIRIGNQFKEELQQLPSKEYCFDEIVKPIMSVLTDTTLHKEYNLNPNRTAEKLITQTHKDVMLVQRVVWNAKKKNFENKTQIMLNHKKGNIVNTPPNTPPTTSPTTTPTTTPPDSPQISPRNPFVTRMLVTPSLMPKQRYSAAPFTQYDNKNINISQNFSSKTSIPKNNLTETTASTADVSALTVPETVD